MTLLAPFQAAPLHSFACRRFHLGSPVLETDALPQAGALALVEVIDTGNPRQLALANHCWHSLSVGDRFYAAVGALDAPLGRSGALPENCGECDLLSDSGIVGVETAHARGMGSAPRVRILGLLRNAGQLLNLRDHAEPKAQGARPPRTLLLVSAARRTWASGAMRQLVRGLSQGGSRVAALQLIGSLDCELHRQLSLAGAMQVLDPIDLGNVSMAHADANQLLDACDTLLGAAARAGADTAVMRLAGGLAQREVRSILQAPGFAHRFDGVVLTAGDALSARAGAALLEQMGLPLLAVSGSLSASPLAMREAQPLPCPILRIGELGGWIAAGNIQTPACSDEASLARAA